MRPCPAWCIVELVMAMGFAPGSNIAQMGGEALLFILDMLMEAYDAVDPVEEAQLAVIMAERHKRHGGSASFTVMNASSLPRIDPVAYNERNEIILPDVVRIASQIMVDA